MSILIEWQDNKSAGFKSSVPTYHATLPRILIFVETIACLFSVFFLKNNKLNDALAAVECRTGWRTE